MKQVVNEGLAAVREEEPNHALRPLPSRQPESVPGNAVSRAEETRETRVAQDGRCSPDPLQRTDRYRLVMPYFDSTRDL